MVDKCCFCRGPIQPVEGVWVGVVSGTASCQLAPKKKHAKQVVLNATKPKRVVRKAS